MGLPCMLPIPLPGAFCSYWNTGLRLMVLISSLLSVSSHYNLILPSDFVFSCDFMSHLLQSLSTPSFCVLHTVWQLRILPFCWISSKPPSLLGSPVELTGLWAQPGHPLVAESLREVQCHTGALCVLPGAGTAHSQAGLCLQDSQTAAQRRCPARTLGSLSMSWAGLYLQELCRWCFPALRLCLPKRSRKNSWGRTEKEEETSHQNRTLGRKNNLSSPVTLGDNWRAL